MAMLDAAVCSRLNLQMMRVMDGVVKTGIGGRTSGLVGNGSEMGAIGDIGDVWDERSAARDAFVLSSLLP
jgi:hypothetical protein